MRAIMSSVVFLPIFLLLSQPLSLNAINMEHAKESKCFEIKKTDPVDLSWAVTIKTYYYIAMSRLELYNSGVEISGKQPGDLHEDELYYDSCISYSVVPGGFLGSGFGGNEKFWATKPVKGLDIFEFISEGDEGFGSGTCYNVLTDNKTFVVSACCYSSHDQMTWAAFSTEKQLPEDTIKRIHDYVESIGFKREYFTALRYESCKFEKNMDEKREL